MTDEQKVLSHVDLFSGIGGFRLAAEWAGFQTIAFSEVDEYAIAIEKEFWPHVPNIGDITKVNWSEFRNANGVPALVTGGCPCQPASACGHMRGTADERWLWPEAIRMARELRPRFLVFENPPSLLNVEDGWAFNGIAANLVSLGYDLWWDVFPAAAFGAGHLRERLIIVCSHIDNINRRSGTEGEHGKETYNGYCKQKGKTSSDCGNLNEFASKRSLQRGRNPIRNGGEGISTIDSNDKGLQGHFGHGEEIGEGQKSGGSIAAPDLRGRVSCENW